MRRCRRPRLGRQVLVLGHELARGERRALRVGDHGHPHPGGVERRHDHLAAELRGLLRDRVGVVDARTSRSSAAACRGWSSAIGMMRRDDVLEALRRRRPRPPACGARGCRARGGRRSRAASTSRSRRPGRASPSRTPRRRRPSRASGSRVLRSLKFSEPCSLTIRAPLCSFACQTQNAAPSGSANTAIRPASMTSNGSISDAAAGVADLGRGLVGAVDPDVGVPHRHRRRALRDRPDGGDVAAADAAR